MSDHGWDTGLKKERSYKAHYCNDQGYLTTECLLDSWIASVLNFLSVIIILWSCRKMSFFFKDICCSIWGRSVIMLTTNSNG